MRYITEEKIEEKKVGNKFEETKLERKFSKQFFQILFLNCSAVPERFLMVSFWSIEEIQKDLNEGRTYGVTGTPGFFIGNEKIGFVELKGAQPFESFKKIINSQLDN